MSTTAHPKLVQTLLDVTATKDILLFAGAGCSAEVGIPTWAHYLEELADTADKYESPIGNLMRARIKSEQFLTDAHDDQLCHPNILHSTALKRETTNETFPKERSKILRNRVPARHVPAAAINSMWLRGIDKIVANQPIQMRVCVYRCERMRQTSLQSGKRLYEASVSKGKAHRFNKKN